MADKSPWVGWLVVGTIGFVVGRGCQPSEPQQVAVTPLYDTSYVDTADGAATAAEAAGEAATAARGASSYDDDTPVPLYASQPVYEPAPSYVPPTYVPDSFANCSEARAAGAAPVYAGDPGYARRLDRDGDGVGCEN